MNNTNIIFKDSNDGYYIGETNGKSLTGFIKLSANEYVEALGLDLHSFYIIEVSRTEEGGINLTPIKYASVENDDKNAILCEIPKDELLKLFNDALSSFGDAVLSLDVDVNSAVN